MNVQLQFVCLSNIHTMCHARDARCRMQLRLKRNYETSNAVDSNKLQSARCCFGACDPKLTTGLFCIHECLHEVAPVQREPSSHAIPETKSLQAQKSRLPYALCPSNARYGTFIRERPNSMTQRRNAYVTCPGLTSLLADTHC